MANPTIALAAGGTGGHMFPAQALGAEAKRRGWRVLLLTDARGMRYADDFPADRIVILDAANPNVSGMLAKLDVAKTMARGTLTARRALKDERVKAVIGFGGYPSAPGLAAARTLRLPIGVHEQNAILGRVNRRMAANAAFVAHGFERLDRLPEIKGERLVIGNPVREAVRAAARAPYDPPTPEGELRVLIFGGSQGARLFADVFPGALAALPEPLRQRLRVTHQVSDDAREAVATAYELAGIDAELAPFFTDLPDRIAKSHYVIARAGAGTISELSIIGRPCLLIPLGIAMDDHQRINAEVLVDAEAGDLLLERDLSEEAALAILSPRLGDAEGLAVRATAAQGRVPSDAAERLADAVEALLRR